MPTKPRLDAFPVCLWSQWRQALWEEARTQSRPWATGNEYSHSGRAPTPLLAGRGAIFGPKKAHMTVNSNLHLFWQFDICFPMCGVLLPLTQIWLISAGCSQEMLSSWLNFQAPNLTAQVKGVGFCLLAKGEHQIIDPNTLPCSFCFSYSWSW